MKVCGKKVPEGKNPNETIKMLRESIPLGSYPQITREFVRQSRIESREASRCREKGNAAYNSGSTETAIQHLQKGIEISSGSGPENEISLSLAELNSKLSRCLRETHKALEETIKTIEGNREFIEKSENCKTAKESADLLRQIGEGRRKQAMDHAETAIEHYANSGDYDKVELNYRSLVSMHEENGTLDAFTSKIESNIESADTPKEKKCAHTAMSKIQDYKGDYSAERKHKSIVKEIIVSPEEPLLPQEQLGAEAKQYLDQGKKRITINPMHMRLN